MNRGRPTRRADASSGFSLLELLLAAALGVLMTTAVIGLFVSNTRGYALQSGQARLQESARLALHFVAQSARSAGYLGCGSGGNLADGTGGVWRSDPTGSVAAPVAGVDDLKDARDARAYGLGKRRFKRGSDVVLFRRIDALGHDLAAPFLVGRDLVLASRFRPETGQLVAVSGCGQLGLLTIKAIAKGSGRVTMPKTVDLDALVPTGVEFGGLLGPASAVVAPVIGETYFVAESRFVNNRGERGWSLWRRAGRADEVVSGVDDLQLLYGIDTTPDDANVAPERYVAADAIGGAVVRTVRIAITASSVDAVTDDDQPLTRTVAQTVALRNRWAPL